MKVKSEEEKNINELIRELDPETHIINRFVKKVIKNIEKEFFKELWGVYERPTIFN